jgi:predicted RNA binding protein YcfA (HicA-like mRNA interferase family)
LLFTDVSSERAIKALKKAGFEIIKQGKHTSMSKKGNILLPFQDIKDLIHIH